MEKCDFTPQHESAGLNSTCGLDTEALLHEIKRYTASVIASPRGHTTLGESTKLCDDSDVCLYLTSNHVVGSEEEPGCVQHNEQGSTCRSIVILKRDAENNLATFVEAPQSPPVPDNQPGLRLQPVLPNLESNQPVAWAGPDASDTHKFVVSTGLTNPELKVDLVHRLLALKAGIQIPKNYACASGISLGGQSGSLVFDKFGKLHGVLTLGLAAPYSKPFSCWADAVPVNRLLADSFQILHQESQP